MRKNDNSSLFTHGKRAMQFTLVQPNIAVQIEMIRIVYNKHICIEVKRNTILSVSCERPIAAA